VPEVPLCEYAIQPAAQHPTAHVRQSHQDRVGLLVLSLWGMESMDGWIVMKWTQGSFITITDVHII
jgi:hypothetical protein